MEGRAELARRALREARHACPPRSKRAAAACTRSSPPRTRQQCQERRGDAAQAPAASAALEGKTSSSTPPAARPIPTPARSALVDPGKRLSRMLRARNFRREHRLDDQRRRHRDSGECAERTRTATAAMHGEHRKPDAITARVMENWRGSRPMPAATAIARPPSALPALVTPSRIPAARDVPLRRRSGDRPTP